MAELLEPRPIPGPVQHRGEVRGWQELWDFSLVQEGTHKLSENDKARGLAYFLDLANRAEHLEKPRCRILEFGDHCRRD